MNRRVVVVALAVAAILSIAPRPMHAGPAPRALAHFHYRIAYDPNAKDPGWDVTIDASGLDPKLRDLVLEIGNWGEWTNVADEHLTGLASEPPLTRDPANAASFHCAPPKRWDGKLHVTYRVRAHEQDSKFHAEHGLLPRRTKTYCSGFTSNTLMMPLRGGDPLESEREIEIAGPDDWTILSGFAPTARGRQTARMDPAIANTVVVFCEPRAIASATDGPTPIEVAQLGGTGEVAAPMLALVRRVADEATHCFGVPPAHPIRIVITEPGEGGVRVDGAICVGFSDGMGSARPSPYTVQFVAHEMTHDWLGGRIVVDDGKCAWFVEGFTEYLSLWIVAATGLVDREWFLVRLRELEAQVAKLPAYATAEYADPKLFWRDPAIEPLAYQAAPVLAFALDARLRRAKRPGLPELVRDLIAAHVTKCGGAEVAAWLEKHGLEKCQRDWIAGKTRPKVEDVFTSLAGEAKDGETRALPDEFFRFDP